MALIMELRGAGGLNLALACELHSKNKRSACQAVMDPAHVRGRKRRRK